MESATPTRIDFDALREKLADQQGPQYWRSLEQLAETPEFNQWLADEFPNRSTLDQIDRRSLLKFMGASMLLAGLAGCRSTVLPSQKIVPYVQQPEELVNSKPLKFASAMPMDGYTYPVVVESHYGRPTKLDGNERAGNVASTYFMQASVLDLYDPDRSRNVRRDQGSVAASWDDFKTEVLPLVASLKRNRGKGVAILIEPTSSPTEKGLLNRLKAQMPEATIATWSVGSRDNVLAGTAQVCGQFAEPIYHLEKARVIVSLGADFIGQGPDRLSDARGWASGRKRIDDNPESMSRVYALEVNPGLTGAVADHTLPVSQGQLLDAAGALAARMGVSGAVGGAPTGELAKFLDAIFADAQSLGSAVFVAGEQMPAELHALVALMNQAVGAVGAGIVEYLPSPIYLAGRHGESMKALCEQMNAGQIELLVMLGGNPVYNAPADLKFSEGLAKVKQSLHLGSHLDETSKLCSWHMPHSHYLESWGDGWTADGRLTVQQPLIDPLYDSKSAAEVLGILLGDPRPGYDFVREQWEKGKVFAGAFEQEWRQALSDGFVAKKPAGLAVSGSAPTLPARISGVEVLVVPDPTIHDGRFANNGWLQELPKPLTTLTWDNVIHVGVAKAKELGLNSGDRVSVTVGDTSIEGPCWVMMGQVGNVVVVHMGGGRDIEGYIAKGTGFNAQKIYTTGSLNGAVSGAINKGSGSVALAATQTHHSMEGRDLIKTVALAEFLNPEEKPHHHLYDMSMYNEEEHKNDLPQWGMSIDLNVCTGCHACVTACQAENNIAVVGKEQVLVGREMHWIRIDRYYGPKSAQNNQVFENPSVHFMPVACMHCEKAPCEPVCPVAATIHSSEGLNQMVYNRCVGTRYCSNNCPYKVRRFNFLNYADRKYTEAPEFKDLRSLTLVRNPDVTVRGRGVMEKCTFCVQRINEARQSAKVAFSKGQREKPEPKEGEVITACQAACPTGAIVFGNIADKESAVVKEKSKKRNYELLPELNTRNRLTYLHMVKNPNKELETV